MIKKRLSTMLFTPFMTEYYGDDKNYSFDEVFSMGTSTRQEIVTLIQRGELEQAKSKAICACSPHYETAESWLLLAMVYTACGEIKDVLKCCKKSLEFDANDFQANYNYAIALDKSGDYQKAIRHYNKSIELSPNVVDIHFKLGNLYFSLKDYQEASTCFKKFLIYNSEHIGALGGLANSLLEIGKNNEAIGGYLKIIKMQPDLVEAHFNLGTAYYRYGRSDLAIPCFQKAIQKEPDNTNFYNSLGASLVESRDFEGAINAFNKAISCYSKNLSAHTNIGSAYSEIGLTSKAIASYEKAIEINPDYEPALLNIGNLYALLGKLEQANLIFGHVLTLSAGNAEAVSGKANVLIREGKIKEALSLLRRLIKGGSKNTDLILSYATIETAKSKQENKKIISLLHDCLKHNNIQTKQRINIHYSLGDKYNNLGDYKHAFQHYQKANNYAFSPIDIQSHFNFIDNIIAFFDNIDSSLKIQDSNSVSSPIFIIGMPRSGTSLVEQIITTNDSVFGAGELTDIPELAQSISEKFHDAGKYPQCLSYLNKIQLKELSKTYLQTISDLSGSAKYVTDKMPYNFIHIGMISLLFPKAKIIHCSRDPVDTCLSCYFQNFTGYHPYFQDLTTLGKYYKAYSKLMNFWKSSLAIPILDVRYENLVENQASASKKIIEFCGLEWDESYLDFYKNKRITHTASYNQVKKPIYTDSVRRRDKYIDYIDELLLSLN